MTKHRLAQKLLDENAVEEKARNLSLLLSKGRPSADITAAAAIHPHELLPPLIDLLGTLSPAVDAYVSDTIARQTLALFPETWAKWIRALGSTTASAALLEELMSNDGKLTGTRFIEEELPSSLAELLHVLCLLYKAFPRVPQSGSSLLRDLAKSEAPAVAEMLSHEIPLPKKADEALLSVLRHRLSPKKAAEVEALAELIAAIAKRSGADVVIEIGAGKGYLSQLLAFRYGILCIALEGSSSIARSSTVRAQRIRAQCLHAIAKAYDVSFDSDSDESDESEPSDGQTEEGERKTGLVTSDSAEGKDQVPGSSDGNGSRDSEQRLHNSAKKNAPNRLLLDAAAAALREDFGSIGRTSTADNILDEARLAKRRRRPVSRRRYDEKDRRLAKTVRVSDGSRKESSIRDLWERVLPTPLSIPFFIDPQDAPEETDARLARNLREEYKQRFGQHSLENMDTLNSSKEELRSILVGLHTCGDLATSALSWGLPTAGRLAEEGQEESSVSDSDETVTKLRSVGVINVGCCYHKDTRKIIFGKDDAKSAKERKRDKENHMSSLEVEEMIGCRFPLSRIAKEGQLRTGFLLTSVAKELACHDIERWIERHLSEDFQARAKSDVKTGVVGARFEPINVEVQLKHAYRALFEVLAGQNESEQRKNYSTTERKSEKETIGQSSEAFKSYVDKNCARLRIARFSDDEIERVWEENATKSNLSGILGLYILRLAIAPAAELAILLDREEYCREKLVDNQAKTKQTSAKPVCVACFPVFNPSASPRNFAVIAFEDLKTTDGQHNK